MFTHDRVMPPSESVAFTEQEVGVLQAVVRLAQLIVSTIWLLSCPLRQSPCNSKY